MKTKWASCSSQRNITLNILLTYLPSHFIRYIVYHELVHRIQRNHTKIFWDIIRKEFKDYQRYENELFVYWFLIHNKNNFKNLNNSNISLLIGKWQELGHKSPMSERLRIKEQEVSRREKSLERELEDHLKNGKLTQEKIWEIRDPNAVF